MKGIHVALAAVGGALVGAAAALLLAPEKGEKTRKEIKKFIKNNCPFVDGEAEELAEVVEQAVAQSKSKK